MNKKKIIGLCIAGALVVGSIGGSLAWFTSSDSITNPFATASTENNNKSITTGLKIHENFDDTKADNTLPGDNVTKQVNVTNTATYDQLVRVKIKKQWKDANGNVITSIWTKNGVIVPANTEGATEEKLNTDYIVLNFKNNTDGNRLTSASDPDKGKWIQETDAKLGNDGGYYYYYGVLAPQKNTGNLLESVTLSPNVPNEYKGLKFDVTVNAEGIQASNGAAKDSWTTAPEIITNLGAGENQNK